MRRRGEWLMNRVLDLMMCLYYWGGSWGGSLIRLNVIKPLLKLEWGEGSWSLTRLQGSQVFWFQVSTIAIHLILINHYIVLKVKMWNMTHMGMGMCRCTPPSSPATLNNSVCLWAQLVFFWIFLLHSLATVGFLLRVWRRKCSIVRGTTVGVGMVVIHHSKWDMWRQYVLFFFLGLDNLVYLTWLLTPNLHN